MDASCSAVCGVMFFLSSFLPVSLSSCVSTGKQWWLSAVRLHRPCLEAALKVLLLPSAAATCSTPLPCAGLAASAAPQQNHSGEGQGQYVLLLPLRGWGLALSEQVVAAKAMPWPDIHLGSCSCWWYPHARADHGCAATVTYSKAGSHRASVGMLTPVSKLSLVTASLGQMTFIFIAG